MRTAEGRSLGEAVVFAGTEPCATDFTEKLSFGAVVLVEIVFGGIAAGTLTEIRNVRTGPASDRRNGFAIPPLNVRDEVAVIPRFIRDYFRKFIDLELLVSGRVGIIKCPLFERDVSADKVQKLADDLLLVIDKLKEIKYNVHEQFLLLV